MKIHGGEISLQKRMVCNTGRGDDTERDLLSLRKNKDEDDWRPWLDKEDSKRGERERRIFQCG